jgi:transcriptional regulator with XRE-family HTH domain
MNDHAESLEELGRRIRAMRVAKGFSQEAFAAHAGIDRSYMGGIERGQRNITFLVMCQIAAALKCDVARLGKGLPLK